jgi:hypothetical protein
MLLHGCGRRPRSRDTRSATIASRPCGPCLGVAAELHRAFRNVVDVIFHVFVNLVEQLVQGDEIGSLDVPVSLFGLRLQVNRVGQSSIEQLNYLDAGSFGQIIFVLNIGPLL